MHLIFTAATPVSDRTSQIVQFCIRNDTEADASAESITAFDRQVVNEDKVVLETTTYDTPLKFRQNSICLRTSPASLCVSNSLRFLSDTKIQPQIMRIRLFQRRAVP